MTDRDALRVALTKTFLAIGKLEGGIRHNTYNNAIEALLGILPSVKDILDFLYDYLEEEEVAMAREEAEDTV